MVAGSSAIWFGAPNFKVLDVADDGHELTISVESTVTVTGCVACGTRAKPKDRRWVGLRDAPSGDRAVVVRVWRRIWSCPDPDCATKTWTEACELAGPRRVLTDRAVSWATDRIEAIEGTVASIARGFGVSWPTVWSAVERAGQERVEDADRVGETPMAGFDETVMQPAHQHRRRRFITAVVDVASGQIIDIFEGRDAADLRLWLAGMPGWWRAAPEVVSVDPHEGYRKAVTDTVLLDDITLVVDPFHIVRLANQAVTRCRQRIQHDTLGHRGWARDPLYSTRKLFLLGAERVDETGWEQIWSALRDGDPTGELQDAWVAKEKVRDVYLTDDVTEAEAALDDAIAWCTAPEAGPELRRLAKDVATMARPNLEPSHDRCEQWSRRSGEPLDQAGETRRPRVSQPRQLPPPDLARWRHHTRPSPGHKTPSPT